MDGEFDLKFDFDLLAELPQIDEFLVNKIDDITLARKYARRKNVKTPHLLDLSLTPDSVGCGTMDFEGIKPEQWTSRELSVQRIYIKRQSFWPTCKFNSFYDEIFTLIKDQENVNTKNNTKLAMNLFEKQRPNRRKNIPEFKLMTTKQMSFWLRRFVM